jgi:hypothetical protein
MNIFFRKTFHTLHHFRKGFILPFTMLVSTLILLVAGSSLTLLTKQLYFSKMYKLSQTAYYAADDAISCAIAIDDTYIGADGFGIFPYDSLAFTANGNDLAHINGTLAYVNNKRNNESPPLPSVSLNDIKCANSSIFDTTVSSPGNTFTSEANFSHTFQAVAPNPPQVEDGRVVSYMMRMDLGLDPADVTGTKHLFRCAKVTVKKTPSFRQIIAQGYAQCDNPNGSVERAVVNTTEVQ